MACEPVSPLSAVQGTYLNSRVTSFDRLAQRIAYQIGAPLVVIEAHINAINEFIAIACEMFSKYAGYTEEYLLFDSTLYQPGIGIRLDTLFSITPKLNGLYNLSTHQTGTSALSTTALSSSFDYDLNDYRRVIDVFTFEPGQNSGINTLFTLEQSLAQQTYFAYSMGNYGFDLVSWHLMKEWLELREKVLATRTHFQFDPDTQYLYLIPEPTSNSQFVAAIGCYVEKALKNLVKEIWIQQYALALTKIAVAHVRGKFAGTQLFGGGTVNYTDLMSQGIAEKEKLETKLFEGASAGFGDGLPAKFLVD